jgi:hypothetical protein
MGALATGQDHLAKQLAQMGGRSDLPGTTSLRQMPRANAAFFIQLKEITI